MTRKDIGIVGGGLLGRCLAWRAAKTGARVALYEAGGRQGDGSAAWVAGGMIAPISETVDAAGQIEAMGRHSLAVWPRWLAELPVPVFYRDAGTVLVWHSEGTGEALRVKRALASRQAEAYVEEIEGKRIGQVEPALDERFFRALYIAGEAQLDNRMLLEAVAVALEQEGVECHWETFVADGTRPNAEVVVDCRGMGAKSNWPKLRGVRGEIVRLYAPDIELRCMLRLLHPQRPVYIIPRPGGRLVVGATSVESDDRSSVSVRGALELLTSAYSVLPALAEARILEFNSQVRPALPNNAPAIQFDRHCQVLRINGLYRHGFLLTPTVVEQVLALLSLQEPTTDAVSWRCLKESPEVMLTPVEEVCACV